MIFIMAQFRKFKRELTVKNTHAKSDKLFS